MLTAGDLGCFGCPVLLDFSNSGNGVCCSHDGEVIIAIDIGGKDKEGDENDHKVTHEATSTAGGAGVALLHRAAMITTAAEYIEGGCCCALQFELTVFKWGSCQF
jgi:hypothetical protein